MNQEISPEVQIAAANLKLAEDADKRAFIVILPNQEGGDNALSTPNGDGTWETIYLLDIGIRPAYHFTLSEAMKCCFEFAAEKDIPAFISHAKLGVSSFLAPHKSAPSFIKPDARPLEMFVIGRWNPESGGEYLDDAEPTANAILTICNAKHFGTESEASRHLENVVDEPEKWHVIEYGHNFHARLKKMTEQANAKEPSAPAKSVMQPAEGA